MPWSERNLFMLRERLLAHLAKMSLFFQAEDGIRDADVTGVQTCALPICLRCSRIGRRGLRGAERLSKRETGARRTGGPLQALPRARRALPCRGPTAYPAGPQRALNPRSRGPGCRWTPRRRPTKPASAAEPNA